MIQILVDSSSDYSLSEIKEKNMEFVPISITIGADNYIEGQNLTRNEFYEILKSSEEFPMTSQPSPQAFLEIFRSIKERGDELICILLSSKLSGTYQSAVLAKNMADYDNIHLIDSLSATYSIKIMADYACRLREKGLSSGDIIAKIEALKARVKVIAALDTLEYLKRGGRISKAAAAIGDIANIKPVITVTEEGKVGILSKGIGKNKAAANIVKQLQEMDIDPQFPLYSIYTYGTDNCVKLETKLSDNGFHISSRLQIGATIGAHVGPEAFGAIAVEKSKAD